MRTIVRTLATLSLLAALALPLQRAEAGPWFPPYWWLDARVVLVPGTVNVTVPTGYYPGAVGYPPVFGSYPWRGLPYFWRFRDWLTYTYTGLFPWVTYWHSFYWDPDRTGYVLDLVTLADEIGGTFAPLDPDVLDGLSVASHTWEVNEGLDSGSFSSLARIRVADLPGYVASLPGVDATVLGEFVASKQFTDLLAADPNGEVFVQFSGPFRIPAPGPMVLLAAGLVAFASAARVRARGARRRTAAAPA